MLFSRRYKVEKQYLRWLKKINLGAHESGRLKGRENLAIGVSTFLVWLTKTLDGKKVIEELHWDVLEETKKISPLQITSVSKYGVHYPLGVLMIEGVDYDLDKDNYGGDVVVSLKGGRLKKLKVGDVIIIEYSYDSSKINKGRKVCPKKRSSR